MWQQILMGIVLFLASLFMMMLILVQRGRGGGLTGALGGMGGQSAFGSRAGDVFTRVTVVTAIIWIMLCMITIAYFNPPKVVTKGEKPSVSSNLESMTDSNTIDLRTFGNGSTPDNSNTGTPPVENTKSGDGDKDKSTEPNKNPESTNSKTPNETTKSNDTDSSKDNKDDEDKSKSNESKSGDDDSKKSEGKSDGSKSGDSGKSD